MLRSAERLSAVESDDVVAFTELCIVWFYGSSVVTECDYFSSAFDQFSNQIKDNQRNDVIVKLAANRIHVVYMLLSQTMYEASRPE